MLEMHRKVNSSSSSSIKKINETKCSMISTEQEKLKNKLN